MKNFNAGVITLALGLAFSVNVMAETMSKTKYEFLGKNLEANYKVARTGCNSLAGNAYDICVAEATGNKNITRAELEVDYKPSVQTRYDVRSATAEADFSVAIKKCNDKVGNARNACVKNGEAARAHTMADAMAEIRASKPVAM